MPIEILMPALSPTMEEGTLAKWLVKEGDTVQSGDVIAEIETDKATMEFEAVDEGTIGKVLIAEGTGHVAVNTPIAILLEDGETADDLGATPVATAPVAQATAGAEAVSEGHPDKPAPQAPVTEKGDRIFATPLARRIAADKGLDLAQIDGSGPRGRITKADVLNSTGAAKPAPQETPSAPAPRPMAPSVSSDAIAKIYADRETVEVPLDNMRRTIADRLTEAKQTVPHFYLRRSVEIDTLLAARSKLNAKLAARDIKLSVNDFIIKACAMALQEVPDANAIWAGDRILRLKPSDVAVAVAIEGGLFTPVLRDAETQSLSALSTQMKDLAKRARDKRLAPHEYQGGSFAISNLGMFGIENFDAVINPPHGAILAVGAGTKQPVVRDTGAIEVATVMSMTLSVDHRVIDGALGAQLLAAICDNLENPVAMLA